MRNPEENPKVTEAVNKYLSAKGLSLPDNAKYEYVIDGVYVCVDDYPVLVIGLPPVSDYPVHETKHTSTLLRAKKAV